MVHQFLFERGEDAAHRSAGWRREIMRLTKQITGKDIWAGRSKTFRRDKHIVRMNRRTRKPKSHPCRMPSSRAGRMMGSISILGSWGSVMLRYMSQSLTDNAAAHTDLNAWYYAIHQVTGAMASRFNKATAADLESWAKVFREVAEGMAAAGKP